MVLFINRNILALENLSFFVYFTEYTYGDVPKEHIYLYKIIERLSKTDLNRK